MYIQEHILYRDDGTPFPFIPSPNTQRGPLDPKYIVFHYTASSTAQSAITWLTSKDSQASAHVLIDRDGSITQLVPFDQIAWHAGESDWQGLKNLNRYSIGVELTNEGVLEQKDGEWISRQGQSVTDVVIKVHPKEQKTRGWQEYPPRQLDAARALARLLVEQYRLQDVLGHDMIHPEKLDPGPAFPMEDIRYELFGRRVVISESASDKADIKGAAQVIQPQQDEIKAPLPDSLAFQSDSPAHEDRLGRRGFAEALCTWLSGYWDELSEVESQSFAIHIQGQWGSGKTTLLNLLQEKLQETGQPTSEINNTGNRNNPWIVVWFNAWQHQHIEPAWWPLLDTVYRESTRQLSLSASYEERAQANRIRDWERLWRIRVGNNKYLLALLVSLLALIALIAWSLQTEVPADKNYVTILESPAKAISAVIALLATIWAGVRFFTTSLFFGSSNAADMFLKMTPDPLEQIKKHFAALVKMIDRPLIVFIDDLDRCRPQHVVQLIESIQTLFNDSRVFYAVASDRRWLYVCFETVYKDFLSQIKEPGRRLGYLFLEKFFQLSVAIPEIPAERRKRYLNFLLKVTTTSILEDMWQEARQEFAGINTQEQLIEKLAVSSGNEIKDQIRAEAAVAQSASQEIAVSDKHFLQQFEALLEPNPRSMKRLINAYGVYRALAMQSDVQIVANETHRIKLALWTILSLRWPMLAEYLEDKPQAIEDLRTQKKVFTKDDPPELRSLEGNPDVLHVINGDGLGVQLDGAALSLLLGIKASRKTPAVVA